MTKYQIIQLMIAFGSLVATQCGHPLNEWQNDDLCGTRPIRHPKIINGSTAVHGHHPWLISLQLNNRHHCGGSLIRPNWVLTAAHCVYRLHANRFRVKLGGHRRNVTAEPTSIRMNVTKVIPHAGFSYATFADDLALVQLQSNVTYSSYIRPICLPVGGGSGGSGGGGGDGGGASVMTHKRAMVAGWGKLRQGGLSAEVLQELELPLVENALCQTWYRQQGKFLKIRSTQICAGVEQGGQDACQGDSGSPLMVTDEDTNRSTIIGIVSAGIGCALPKLPGLYTRVTSYINWIDSMIRANDEQETTTIKNNLTSSTPVSDVTMIPTTTVESASAITSESSTSIESNGPITSESSTNAESTSAITSESSMITESTSSITTESSTSWFASSTTPSTDRTIVIGADIVMHPMHTNKAINTKRNLMSLIKIKKEKIR